ncbi:hypothetical protein ABH904_001202 [Pseudomonas frederiksbergensis]
MQTAPPILIGGPLFCCLKRLPYWVGRWSLLTGRQIVMQGN